jgi:hypothetical protein
MEQRHGHALRERKAKYKQQMKFLGAVMGKTKRDNQKCTHQRRTQVEDIRNQVERNRLRWFGHVQRKDEYSVPRRVLNMKMSGKRSRGSEHGGWTKSRET